MTNRKPIVIISGQLQNISDTDSLLAGGIKTTTDLFNLDADSIVLRNSSLDTRLTITNNVNFSVTVAPDVTSVTFGQTQHASGTGNAWTIRAQKGAAGFSGGKLTIGGGASGNASSIGGGIDIKLGQLLGGVSALMQWTDESDTVLGDIRVTAGGLQMRNSAASNTSLSFIATGFFLAQTSSGQPVVLESVGNGQVQLATNAIWYKNGAEVYTDTLNATGACGMTYAAGVTSVTFNQTNKATAGTGAAWTIRAQKGHTSNPGGALIMGGGDGATPGTDLSGDTLIHLGTLVSNTSAKLSIRTGDPASSTEAGFIYYTTSSGLHFVSAAAGGINLQATSASQFAKLNGPQLALEASTGVFQITTSTTGTKWYPSGALALTEIYHATGANTTTYEAGCTSVTYNQTQATSGIGAAWTIRAQQGFAGSIGGALTIGGGDGGTVGTNLAGATNIELGTANAGGASARLNFLGGSGGAFGYITRYTGGHGIHLVSNNILAVQAATAMSLEALNGIAVLSGTTDLYLGGNSIFLRNGAATLTATLVLAPTGASAITWVTGITSLIDSQSDKTAAGNASHRKIVAQSAGNGGNGGNVIIEGGAQNGGNLRGGVKLRLDTANAVTMADATEVVVGQRVLALVRGSDLTSTQMPSNTGDLVIYIGNTATAPTADPVSGGILYVESGALKYRGTGGTVTTLGVA